MRYEYSLQITKMQSEISVCTGRIWMSVPGVCWAPTSPSTQVNPWSLLSKDFVSATFTKLPGAHCAFKHHSSCWRYWHWLIRVLAHQPRLSALPHGSGWGNDCSSCPQEMCICSLWGENNIFAPVVSNLHGFLIIRGFSLVQQHVVKQSL